MKAADGGSEVFERSDLQKERKKYSNSKRFGCERVQRSKWKKWENSDYNYFCERVFASRPKKIRAFWTHQRPHIMKEKKVKKLISLVESYFKVELIKKKVPVGMEFDTCLTFDGKMTITEIKEPKKVPLKLEPNSPSKTNLGKMKSLEQRKIGNNQSFATIGNALFSKSSGGAGECCETVCPTCWRRQRFLILGLSLNDRETIIHSFGIFDRRCTWQHDRRAHGPIYADWTVGKKRKKSPNLTNLPLSQIQFCERRLHFLSLFIGQINWIHLLSFNCILQQGRLFFHWSGFLAKL